MKWIDCPTCAGGAMAYDFHGGCPDCKGTNRLCSMTTEQIGHWAMSIPQEWEPTRALTAELEYRKGQPLE